MGDGTSRVYEESYVQDDDDDSQSGMQTYFNIISTSSDVRENMMLDYFPADQIIMRNPWLTMFCTYMNRTSFLPKRLCTDLNSLPVRTVSGWMDLLLSQTA